MSRVITGNGATRSTAKIRRGMPTSRRAAAPKRITSTGIAMSIARRGFNALPISEQMLQRMLHWVVMAIIVLALALVARVTGLSTMVADGIADAIGRAGFRVEKVEVSGARQLDRMRIYDTALAQKNRSMAAVDIDELRRELLSYGWVADARVSRRLPDTLVVDLVERTPVAVWQNQGRLALIDKDGVVLQSITASSAPNLPLLIGPNANRRAQDLEDLLSAAPSLKSLMAGANWVGNRRWDIRFRSGEVLALPEGKDTAKEALANFVRIDGVNRLLDRGVVRFDMRDPTRFVLRVPRKDGEDASLAAASPTALPDAPADDAVTTPPHPTSAKPSAVPAAPVASPKSAPAASRVEG